MQDSDDSQPEDKGGPTEAPARGPGPIPPAEQTKNTAELSFLVSRVSLAYRYFFLLSMTLVGVVLFLLLVPISWVGRDYPVLVLLAAWSFGLIRYWAYLLGMPHRILVKGKSVVFVSLLRRKEFDQRDIIVMKVSPIYPSYLKIIVLGRKSVTMINHIDKLHELIWIIRTDNPELETKGC